ncbi:MAG TPA: nucleotidyltransferase domain-containing protein [Candidatus Omnitrophica bacterium]|nr:nucleotidyltransferase domain-containing protein [Candidatus Omnitrophota bacterium]HBG64805.1 nucleotidyltransferase domain-containing protein [Candidatus Omnitrophota bacterium]
MQTYKIDKVRLIAVMNSLKRDNSLLAIYLFGSRASGKARKYSDIDIAALYDEKVDKKEYTDKRIEIMTAVSELLDREVDVVVLNQAPPILKYHILKYGMRLYERSNRQEHSFEVQAIQEYFDFLPIRNRMEQGLIKKVKTQRW